MWKRILPALIAAMVCFVVPAFAADRDKWIEIRSPNFIVVSNAGEGQARKVAVQFEQVRSLFRDSFAYVRAHTSPVITILAAKDESSLRELLPEFWESKGSTHPAGIFLNNLFQFQVAINLSAHGENPFKTIYHEYYHSVTTPYFRNLPVWMAEGFADFYGNTVFADKDASLGLPDASLIQELRTRPLIPLDVLFKVDHNSPYYNEQSKVSIFYAQSWALTHFLMLGDKQARRPTFGTYLEELDRGGTPDQAAAKAFGSLDRLQADLQQYIRGFSFPYVKVPAPPKISSNELLVRSLSDAEADAYRGGFLVMHGQYKYAQPLLEEAARLDSGLALAQENLALLYYAQRLRTEALSSLSAAIQLNPRNAGTRYLRASLTFSGGSVPTRDPQIEDDLRQAVVANQNFAPSYGLLATYLAAQAENLPEALTFAQKGVSLEPGKTEYQFALAQVLARMRRYDEAEGVARRIQANASDAREREDAGHFLEYVSQARESDALRLRQQQAMASSRPRELAAPVPPGGGPRGEPPGALGNSSDSAEPRIVLRRRGNRLEGIVTQVSCRAGEMQLTLQTAGNSVLLRASDISSVSFMNSTAAESADVEPCLDLKGHTVTIVTADVPRPGEITQIDILK